VAPSSDLQFLLLCEQQKLVGMRLGEWMGFRTEASFKHDCCTTIMLCPAGKIILLPINACLKLISRYVINSLRLVLKGLNLYQRGKGAILT